MPDPEQHEIPFKERRIKNHRLRRGIFLIPSLFTSANLLCGYYAVIAASLGTPEDLNHAAKAIGFAILFDSLDGRLARLLGANTDFGVQFDSLADVVSFGIAPAALAYAWGVRSVVGLGAEASHDLGRFAWLCCLVFSICCAWRLARFNIQGMLPGSSNRFFVGMPAPAAAGMVAATVHGVKFPIDDWRLSLAWLLLVGALATLMVSTLRFYSFKDLGWQGRHPSLIVVFLALLIWSIFLYSEEVLLLIGTLYTLSGPTYWLARTVRHRLASRPA